MATMRERLFQTLWVARNEARAVYTALTTEGAPTAETIDTVEHLVKLLESAVESAKGSNRWTP